MADAEIATKPSPAVEGVAPSSTADSGEVPPSQPAPAADPPTLAVNGVPEPGPTTVAAAVADVPADTAEDASSKSDGTYSSTGVPRIDVSDDSEKIAATTTKYELHDKEAEAADRVAAALKSARLQVTSRASFISKYC